MPTFDPYLSSVVALLHFDGTDGSSSVVDEIGTAWVATNSPYLTTADRRFGSSAILFDVISPPLGPMIVAADAASLRMGTSECTIEGWFLPQEPNLGVGVFYRKGENYTGSLQLGVTPSAVWWRAGDVDVTVGVSISGWTHVAFVRVGNTRKIFVAGVEVLSQTEAYDNYDTGDLTIGCAASNENYGYKGHIDDLRITKGVARYTANFTPPTEAFPNDAPPQTLALLGIDSAQIDGVVDATHWLQYARPEGLRPESIGAHSLGESPLTVSPPWWYSTVFGHPFVGEYLTISPTGIGGEFGQATAVGLLQAILPYGDVHSLVGTQFVELNDRHLSPLGYAQTLQGMQLMEPMLRTLLHSAGIPQNQGIGVASVIPMTLWPNGLWAGVAADRVTVSRSGDVLNPGGLNAGAIGRAFVSWHERTLPLLGFDAMYSSGWHHTRNDARLLSPTAVTGSMGSPVLVNELRTLQVNFPPQPLPMGTAWVDRAVRTSQVVEGVPNPLWPSPVVQNWERYIEPAGYWQVTTGGLYVEGRQNRIVADRTVPSTLWGAAGVVNEDRELSRIGGIDAGPRGLPKIFRDPESLTTAGMVTTIFGTAQAMDSTRTVRTAFAGSGGWVPETHWLRKELPDPPTNRVILDVAVGSSYAIGEHTVRTNWIYPDGFTATGTGVATVTINGIRPRGIPPPGYDTGGPVGVPSLPGTQWVYGDDDMDFGSYGVPRMTPHYIFAPGAESGGQYIDEHLYGPGPARPRFGNALVTHEVRTLFADHQVMTIWGNGEAQNKHRKLSTVGPRLFKPGFPNIRSGGDLQPNGLDATLWGDAVVGQPTHTGDQTATVAGMFASYGTAEVQNQNRALTTGGLDATLHGTQWVSYQYDPFQIGSVLSLQAGEPLVEYLHRGLDLDGAGFDALDMTPFPGWSGDRMRVRPVSFITIAAGSVHSRMGAVSVELHHRTIGVGGIERPQIQVPEGARCLGELQIAPDGLDAGVLGGPRMWEPGDDLLPYAEDMLSLGTARMIGVVQPGGFEALLIGDIRIAVPAAPDGAVHTDWGAAVVAHDGGGRICNSHYSLAIAMAAMDPSTIGSHGVAHDP